MPASAFQQFRDAVAKDKQLQKALRAAAAKGPDALVKLGNDKGFKFTKAEAEAAIADAELSDLELELVSGGVGGAGSGGKGDGSN